jgi:hypothetical protein
MQNKTNFRKSQMNVSIFSKMAYENKHNWTLGENKPNQTQFKPKTNPISKIPKMKLNLHPTRDYENKPLHRRGQNKPNQTQNKANLYFKPGQYQIIAKFRPTAH